MYYLGVDLGGTNIAAGIVDYDGKIIYKESIPTLNQREHTEIVNDMAALSKKVIRDAGLEPKDIESIGIGVPGIADQNNGTIIYTCNIKFHNVPIRKMLQKYIDLPVYVENDANCAALAESIAGAAKDAESSVTITLGTGIGGGIVIGGRIYSGFNCAGGELGHMVISMDGNQCTCGRKGCWETYASATALIKQTREAAKENPDSLINKLVNGDLSKITAKTAFDAAKQNDATGRQVVFRYTKYLAEGLTNVINIFQPQVVVIGGGVSKEGEYLLEPLRKMVGEIVYGRGDTVPTQIKAAQMGNDAGIIGAALLKRMNQGTVFA